MGTYGNKVQRAFNAAFFAKYLDADDIIQHALDDLTECYQVGDELFLFGFSRGAAIARQFAVKLETALPDKNPKVRFMGVFDTVASMGIKDFNLKSDEKPVSDVLFENQTIAKIVQEALHILALDERRKAFQPTLMNKEDRVTEVWFSGVHSDIGGGFRLDGLSDITLQFMLDQFRDRQLSLQIRHPREINYEALLPASEQFKIDYSDVMLTPDPFSPSHQQKRLRLASLITLHDRLLRVNQDDQPCNKIPVIHNSVVQRIHHDSEYRPPSLMHVNHLVLMPNGKKIEFDGLKAHKEMGTLPLVNLQVGESEKVRVYANQKYNASRVMLHKGGSYYFTCDLQQKWFDASIDASVKGWTVDEEMKAKTLGRVTGTVIGWSKGFSPSTRGKWFELVAAINDNDDELFQVLKYTDTQNRYQPSQSGEFCPFANDLWFKYGNNIGFVDVVIHRV